MSSKAAKLKKSAVKPTVYEYMKSQNRPFNDKMVYENLHGAAPRSQICAALEELATEGKVMRKEFGKQKVFWVDQGIFPEVSADELGQLDDEIERLRQAVKDAEEERNAEARVVTDLQATLSDDELRKKIAALEEKTKAQEERLVKLRANQSTVSREDFEKAGAALEKKMKVWRQRRRTCMTIVNEITESSNQPVKKFKDKVGLEFDEDCKVSLKEMTAKVEAIGQVKEKPNGAPPLKRAK